MPSPYRRRGDLREHVAVWQEAHGPVPRGYLVHHRNEDRADNRLRNLRLMTRAQHTQLHHAGKISPMRGKKYGPDFGAKVSAALRGKPKTAEHIAHVRKALQPFYDAGGSFGLLSATARSDRGRAAAHARWS